MRLTKRQAHHWKECDLPNITYKPDTKRGLVSLQGLADIFNLLFLLDRLQRLPKPLSGIVRQVSGQALEDGIQIPYLGQAIFKQRFWTIRAVLQIWIDLNSFYNLEQLA